VLEGRSLVQAADEHPGENRECEQQQRDDEAENPIVPHPVQYDADNEGVWIRPPGEKEDRGKDTDQDTQDDGPPEEA